jgi:hypothetical protein
MHSKGLVSVLALAAMAGCANLAPTVSVKAPPDPNIGYIAAAFSDRGTRGTGFGLILSGPDRKEVVMSFDGPPVSGPVAPTRLGMIAVPPGEYYVDFWVTFSAFREVLTKQQMHGALASSFTVRQGQVVYLGWLFGSTATGVGTRKNKSAVTITASMGSQDLDLGFATSMVRSGYPKFSAAPVECVLCSRAPTTPPPPRDTAKATPERSGDAELPATKEQPPDTREAPPPVRTKAAQRDAVKPGTLVLHLHRADGDYAGWGLAVWETNEAGKMRRMIAGLANPMAAAGVDDFGAYWVLEASDYGDRRVGFLLRKASDKDAAGLNRAWFPGASRQIWLNSGDAEVYFSREKAVAARGTT